ncbi:hypothetical protein KQI42_04895 [Tissierella sp. MSJ-40]|uniref:Uncharacterized protein n=1 Tax=Tissierella simiarum TaxID=2841534 RepID=A0ABS6E513_9FIRM|nr:hypothetical protein [Tissierella simiarum]MBU5437334.1 hypothetical protein [Tissierella simiarum]
MNKEFMKKIIKAEILKYEAFKEILPDCIRGKLNDLEKESMSFLKDVTVEIIEESLKENKRGADEVKKVDIEFS